MNDSMSILLATTILALGGLGLYMFKSSDDNKSEEYNEDSIFGGNFWNLSDDNEDVEKKVKHEEEDDNLEEESYKPRKRVAKTQRNKKFSASSRRRY